MVFIADKPETLVEDVSKNGPLDPIGEFEPTSELPAIPSADSDLGRWLSVLGLQIGASWNDIDAAYQSLSSDLTPSPGANHSKVALANQLLTEVNEAYNSLRVRLAA